MRYNLWKRGIVLGIIILFVGASVVPVLGTSVNFGVSKDITKYNKIKTMGIFNTENETKGIILGAISDVHREDNYISFNSVFVIVIIIRGSGIMYIYNEGHFMISPDYLGIITDSTIFVSSEIQKLP